MHKVHIPERNFKPDELAEAREPSPGPRLLGPMKIVAGTFGILLREIKAEADE